MKILSIDGGGIRGLIPAMVIHHIERETGRPIVDLFDVVAGTSTGGILALGLTCSDGAGRPKFSGEALVALYEENGARIFPHETFGRLRQFVDEKYSSAGLEAVLADKFGDARLKDALASVIVTAYDIRRREPVFFRSARARERPDDYDFAIRDVARATSAAPTYFEPAVIELPAPQPALALVDGGVFANNPGMSAFVDAYAGKADADDTLLVSLGTGVLTRPIPLDDARDWGLAGWARHILDVVFDGVSDAVDYQLRQILGEQYHRLQTALDKGQDEMDDASPENIENLKLEAVDLINTNSAALEKICKALAL